MAKYRFKRNRDGSISIRGIRMEGKALGKMVTVKAHSQADVSKVMAEVYHALYQRPGGPSPGQDSAGEREVRR